jgi:hypothetical protein
MNSILFTLPSGATLDLTNFIAIVPVKEATCYQLCLGGLSQPLTLDSDDAAAVRVFLSERKTATSFPEHNYSSISLKKDNALRLMAARIEKHQNITDEEDSQNAEAFERFQQRIDRDRPIGQKLYSRP